MRGGILSAVSNESPGALSKTQLDKLGDRLREGTADEADLRALDDYRKSFRAAHEEVVAIVRASVGSEGTGRPAKTTTAIVDKLRRQPIRLTQIQDIAGLRLIVNGVLEQDRVVGQLTHALSEPSIDDRRVKPSHGYRAVHLVADIRDRLVEVQIRTEEQHLWAELSEKLSDVIDPAVKYGGGPESARNTLLEYSDLVRHAEGLEIEAAASAKAYLASKEEAEEFGNDPAVIEGVEKAGRALQHFETSVRQLKRGVALLLSTYYNVISSKPL